MNVPGAADHGGDGHRVASALGLDPATVLDLSASLNPVAPDVRPLVARRLDAVSTYPDADVARAALADGLGVERGRVLLTNGGAEAIALVARDLGRGWAEEDDFSLYRRHLPVLDETAGLVRSDPHNPTGRLAPATASAAVWDEAFYPLATGRWSAGRDAIVVGSLTKLFACPGLRIGYVIGDEVTVARLAVAQPAWSVNGLALAVLPHLLELADLDGWSRQVAKLREELFHVLDAAGLEPEPSDANYVLCANAIGLRERLAPLGVVVRDCASFGRPGQVRVAVPDASGLARLEGALEVIA